MAMDVLVERLDVRILGLEAAIERGACPGDARRTGRNREPQTRLQRTRPPLHRKDFVALICVSPLTAARRGAAWSS